MCPFFVGVSIFCQTSKGFGVNKSDVSTMNERNPVEIMAKEIGIIHYDTTGNDETMRAYSLSLESFRDEEKSFTEFLLKEKKEYFFFFLRRFLTVSITSWRAPQA